MTDERPTHLDLFSGIGGFALAARWAGFRTIGFCEIDKYCQKVLAKNFLADAEHAGCEGSRQQGIARGWKADATSSRCQIWADIFDLDGAQFRGVSLITGGFPCQPFSVAGKRGGAADDRAIWPEMFRVIREARPAWVLGENVPGIIPMELDNVLSDLEGIGYSTRAFVIPACAVDARHRRDRLWVVGRRNVPDRQSEGLEGRNIGIQEGTGIRNTWKQRGTECCAWEPEPDVGFSSDGLSAKLDGGINATNSLSRSSEVLCSLWERVAPSAIQRTAGGQWCISAAEVLLADMHGDRLCQRHIGIICEAQAGCKIPWELLRSVWGYGERGLPSHRREPEQRLTSEYPDLMRLLSYYAPPPCSACWADGSWEDGMPRVAHGIKSRVDRLKGLGNAIVPQVVFELLREIRKLI